MIDSPAQPTAAQRLGGQTFYAFLGTAFALLVGFPLQVYVARVLGVDGYGLFILIEATMLTVTGLLGVGIVSTLVRFVPAYLARGEFGKVRTLLRRMFLFLISIGALAYLFLFVATGWIGDTWPEIASHSTAILLMGMMIPLGLILNFFQQGLRGFQEIRSMVIGSSFVQITVKAIVTVAALILGFGLNGYVFAIIVGAVCAILSMSLGLRREMQRMAPNSTTSGSLDWGEWRHFAAVGYSSSLLSVATVYLARFLLGYFSDSSAVGVFAIIFQIQLYPFIALQMVLVVGAPMFSAAHSRSANAEREHLYHLMTDWVVRISMPLLIFLLLFAGPVLKLYGPGFASQGWESLVILIAAQFVHLACGPLAGVLMMSGRERVVLTVIAMSSVVIISMSFVLIPTFGLIGAAIAFAVGGVFVDVCTLISARRYLGLRWWSRKYLRWIMPGFAAFAVGSGALLSGIGNGAAGLAVSLVAMYLAFAAVTLLQGLSDEDNDLLRYLLNLRGRSRIARQRGAEDAV